MVDLLLYILIDFDSTRQKNETVFFSYNLVQKVGIVNLSIYCLSIVSVNFHFVDTTHLLLLNNIKPSNSFKLDKLFILLSKMKKNTSLVILGAHCLW